MSEASITLVSPWLGPLPKGLLLFLGSVRANPSVRVLIPSDQPAPPNLPPNVTWLPMTLDTFSARASECLGVALHVERGYKLCDFRPTYGVVFAEEIGDADFWGYCDQDQVLGNLRAFLTQTILASADVLTFRGEGWMSGPFSLYRTNSAATRLFEDAPEWDDTLAHPMYQAFDECGMRWEGAQPRSVARCIDNGERVSITDIVHTAAREGRIRLHVDNVLAEPGGGSSNSRAIAGRLRRRPLGVKANDSASISSTPRTTPPSTSTPGTGCLSAFGSRPSGRLECLLKRKRSAGLSR